MRLSSQITDEDVRTKEKDVLSCDDDIAIVLQTALLIVYKAVGISDVRSAVWIDSFAKSISFERTGVARDAGMQVQP